MKNSISPILAIVVALTHIHVRAESGYKDFKWGTLISEIKEKVPDIKFSSLPHFRNGLDYAYFYHFSNEYTGGTELLSSRLGRQAFAFESEKLGLAFGFYDMRLVGVSIKFINEPIYPTLTIKHGKRSIKKTADQVEICVWGDTPDRLIVWTKRDLEFRGLEWREEIVHYIAKPLYDSLSGSAITKHRDKKSRSHEKLD